MKPESRDPETEAGSLEIEKRVHRIHGTLEMGLHKDPSQHGGHKGGPVDLVNSRPIIILIKIFASPPYGSHQAARDPL